MSQYPSGSICLDMSGMNKILEIHGARTRLGLSEHMASAHECSVEDDSDLVCQAGVRWEDINSTLQEKGIPLFFPVSRTHGAGRLWLNACCVA